MQKLVRGSAREDGMVFARYRRNRLGEMVEYWMTPDAFALLLEKERLAQVRKKESGYRSPYRPTPEQRRAWAAGRRALNPTADSDRVRAWRLANPEKCRDWRIRYRASCDIRRLGMNVRSAICQALGDFKCRSAFDYIGCDLRHLIAHLESQFQDGMTWENHGKNGWHIDHRVPMASAGSLEELVSLLHYSNLQPMWALDNLRKGAR